MRISDWSSYVCSSDLAGDRLGRRLGLEVEFALGFSNLRVGAFEDRQIEVLLVADMVVDHALVGASRLGDAVDAGAAEAVAGEFLGRGLEDAQPHPLRVALPAVRGFPFCHASTSALFSQSLVPSPPDRKGVG